MSYLLDANACIALINGAPRRVRARFERVSAAGATIAVSTVVAFDLWYGAAKSSRKDSNTHRLEMFFSGPIELLPFGDDDARTAGEVRAALEAAGTPIGAYDVLIAGQAMRRRVTLVTANVSEFTRVTGLTWEDWATHEDRRRSTR
ncbi:MAG TPA: type II toxin-antitoxin system VapC family toxin [bacterium]|nr:type II toxin-antitoxin system VapC family toxin [bacterium]